MVFLDNSEFKLKVFFGVREFMQRAKNYILKLMMENRQTKTRIISNCELIRDGLLNENVGFRILLREEVIGDFKELPLYIFM